MNFTLSNITLKVNLRTKFAANEKLRSSWFIREEKKQSLIDRLKGLLLLKPAKRRRFSTNRRQFINIILESTGFEMMIGDRLAFKTFYVYKATFIIVICVALAPHSSRTLF